MSNPKYMIPKIFRHGTAIALIQPVMARSTVTLILPHAQGVASERPAVAGMLVRRRRGGSVMFAPIDARLARAQLAAIHAVKISR